MKTKMLIAATIAIVILFTLRAADPSSSSSVVPGVGSVNQRYALFSPQMPSSGGVQQIYMLDTQTGRVWRKVFYTDIKEFYWAAEGYMSADGQTVSATPGVSATLDSMAMQMKYEDAIKRARSEASDKK